MIEFQELLGEVCRPLRDIVRVVGKRLPQDVYAETSIGGSKTVVYNHSLPVGVAAGQKTCNAFHFIARFVKYPASMRNIRPCLCRNPSREEIATLCPCRIPVKQELVVANIGVFPFELGNSLQQGFARPLLGFPIVVVLI